MKHVILVLAMAAAVAAVAALAGCGSLHTKVTDLSVWYMDAPVQRSKLLVYVKPQARHDRPLKALFFPLRMTQSADRPLLLGQQCAKLIWQIWTSREVFHTLAYDEELHLRSHRQAAADARRRGADVAVVGYIPYFLSGGTASNSAVTIQLLIIDARTAETLVSMEESARLDKVLEDDYIFWVRRTRLPDSPIFVAVSAIADDMARPLKTWTGGPYPDSRPAQVRFASNSQEMVSALTPAAHQSSFEPAPLSEGLNSYSPQELARLHESTMQQHSPMESQLADEQSGEPPVVRLKVKFDVDQAAIREASYPLLDELGKALTNPALAGKQIVITGHTDGDGSEAYNQELSQRRAEAVKQYLAKNFDLAPDDIQVEAYGESKPLVPNTSEKNKQINRRVEVQLTEK